MRNYGQHNALLCGIRVARGKTIVTMDDDLQHPPEEVPKLLARLNEGYDVVYGAPEKQQHGLWRDLASEVTKLALQKSMGAETARRVSAFRVFRTELREAFADYHSPFISIDVVLTWGTTRFIAAAVRHDPRQTGASNYTVRQLITHALNMVTGFTILPLQLASLLGFSLCTLFGLGLLVFVIGRYLLQGASVPGFTFLASTVVIFSGAQLFALGIIGEYLARDPLSHDGKADLRDSFRHIPNLMPTVEANSGCVFLEWDSAFFGQRIARLTLNRLTDGEWPAIEAWCRAERIDCLYFLADAGDGETIRLAEDQGFRLVDIRVTLAIRPGGQIPGANPPAEILIRPFQPSDLSALRTMAGRLHRDSRFFFDKGFAENRSREMFETWMEKSCMRSGDQVWVAEDAGKVAGYVTCHLDSRSAGCVELIAVDKPAQRRGVGQALMQAALTSFAAGGVSEVTIATQGRNARALRLYERCGFRVSSLQLWYHRRPGTTAAKKV